MQAMQAVQVPVYDFTLHQRAQETRRVEPADVVIIEGILVLHMESVRKLLNMKIFVDTDDDVRLARRYVLTNHSCHAAHGYYLGIQQYLDALKYICISIFWDVLVPLASCTGCGVQSICCALQYTT